MIPLGILASARRAASSWTPASLTLAAWYDAADPATITESAGLVSQWSDKSGNTRHATQASGSYKPSTGTATLNGLNVISFASDELNISVPIATAAATVVAVWGWSPGLRSAPYGGGTAGAPGMLQAAAGSANWVIDPGASAAPFGVTSSAGALTRTVHAGTSTVHLNGASVHSTSGASVAGTSITALGRTNRASISLQGFLAELVVVDGTLSSGDMADLETYLKTKWGTP